MEAVCTMYLFGTSKRVPFMIESTPVVHLLHYLADSQNQHLKNLYCTYCAPLVAQIALNRISHSSLL